MDLMRHICNPQHSYGKVGAETKVTQVHEAAQSRYRVRWQDQGGLPQNTAGGENGSPKLSSDLHILADMHKKHF